MFLLCGILPMRREHFIANANWVAKDTRQVCVTHIGLNEVSNQITRVVLEQLRKAILVPQLLIIAGFLAYPYRVVTIVFLAKDSARPVTTI